jgi:hypothetical protein
MAIEDILESQLNEIFTLVEAIDCLNLHLFFLRFDFHDKSEFEKNKIRLEEIKTKLSIFRLTKMVRRNYKEYQDSITIYDFTLKECNYE